MCGISSKQSQNISLNLASRLHNSSLCTSVIIWVFTVRQNCSGFVSGMLPSRSTCFLSARKGGTRHNWLRSIFWFCCTFPHFGRFLWASNGLGLTQGLTGSCLLRSFLQCLSTIVQASWSIMIEWEARKDKPKMSFMQRHGTTTAQMFFDSQEWSTEYNFSSMHSPNSTFLTFPEFTTRLTFTGSCKVNHWSWSLSANLA